MQEHLHTEASERPYSASELFKVARDALRMLPAGYVQSGEQMFRINTYEEAGQTYWLVGIMTPIEPGEDSPEPDEPVEPDEAVDDEWDEDRVARIYEPEVERWIRWQEGPDVRG